MLQNPKCLHAPPSKINESFTFLSNTIIIKCTINCTPYIISFFFREPVMLRISHIDYLSGLYKEVKVAYLTKAIKKWIQEVNLLQTDHQEMVTYVNALLTTETVQQQGEVAIQNTGSPKSSICVGLPPLGCCLHPNVEPRDNACISPWCNIPPQKQHPAGSLPSWEQGLHTGVGHVETQWSDWTNPSLPLDHVWASSIVQPGYRMVHALATSQHRLYLPRLSDGTISLDPPLPPPTTTRGIYGCPIAAGFRYILSQQAGTLDE